MATLTPTSQAIYNALTLRLGELNHALSPSHIWAIVMDVMAAIQTNTATVVADAATDTGKYMPPAHGKF